MLITAGLEKSGASRNSWELSWCSKIQMGRGEVHSRFALRRLSWGAVEGDDASHCDSRVESSAGDVGALVAAWSFVQTCATGFAIFLSFLRGNVHARLGDKRLMPGWGGIHRVPCKRLYFSYWDVPACEGVLRTMRLQDTKTPRPAKSP